MYNKISMFRMSTKNKPQMKEQVNSYKESPKMSFRNEDTVFNFDNPQRTQQQLLWQTLTPEMRVEALKRIQLIHMLRQVNPDLQLCRKNSGANNTSCDPTVQTSRSTADKGVQVPDIRFEFINQRKQNNATVNQPKKWATFIAPGVRINPKQNDFQNKTFTESYTNRPDTKPKEQRVAFKPPDKPDVKPRDGNNTSIQKRPSKRIEIKSPDSITEEKQTIVKAKENDPPPAGAKGPKEVETSKFKKLDEQNETIEITISTIQDYDKEDGKNEEPKTERQVLIKPKEASSGEEEDSVVVVLNQPRTEQGLERKYGQFYCRRCMRGWSSRSVWCVRHTSKVYIKQTCNICNKLVNPYLVCHLPPANASMSKPEEASQTEEKEE